MTWPLRAFGPVRCHGEGGRRDLGNVTQGQHEAALDNATPSQTLLVNAKRSPCQTSKKTRSTCRWRRRAPEEKSRARSRRMTSNHPRNIGPMCSTRAAVPELDRAALQIATVAGKRRCRLHGGAPVRRSARQQKSFKHRIYTREALAERQQLDDLVRPSRELLQKIKALSSA